MDFFYLKNKYLILNYSQVESPAGASGLRDLLSDDVDSNRERRSSSEEWEKVDGAESEC